MGRGAEEALGDGGLHGLRTGDRGGVGVGVAKATCRGLCRGDMPPPPRPGHGFPLPAGVCVQVLCRGCARAVQGRPPSPPAVTNKPWPAPPPLRWVCAAPSRSRRARRRGTRRRRASAAWRRCSSSIGSGSWNKRCGIRPTSGRLQRRSTAGSRAEAEALQDPPPPPPGQGKSVLQRRGTSGEQHMTQKKDWPLSGPRGSTIRGAHAVRAQCTRSECIGLLS